MVVGIIDYGMGNLGSVQKAFQYIGCDALIINDIISMKKADLLVLPGVGAFPDAMELLNKRCLSQAIKEEVKSGKPFLGICLGMQLLFQKGYEVKEVNGLGLLKGNIKKIKTNLKIPHVGWNSLKIIRQTYLLNGLKNGDNVYFLHSFYLENGNKDDIYAITKYGVDIPAVVCHDNIFSCQFHPEKSGNIGLQILENFVSFR